MPKKHNNHLTHTRAHAHTGRGHFGYRRAITNKIMTGTIVCRMPSLHYLPQNTGLSLCRFFFFASYGHRREQIPWTLWRMYLVLDFHNNQQHSYPTKCIHFQKISSKLKSLSSMFQNTLFNMLFKSISRLGHLI